MLRQACRVGSLCDYSMPEENSSCSWAGSCDLDPAKRPKKLIRVHSNAGVELLRLHDKVAALR